MLARYYKCNLCGRDIDGDEWEDCWSMVEILGYYSKHDGDAVTMDLCPDCVDKLIEQCVISPIDPYEDEDTDLTI